MEELEFKTSLLQTIDQAVIATDLEGKVTYWNKAAEVIYGWTCEEAIGKNIVYLIPSNRSRSQAKEIMKNLLKGISWSGEFWVTHKNGIEFPVIITNSPIFNSHKELIGIIGTSTDITENKRLKDLLDKASSLAQIGSFEVNFETAEVFWSKGTKQIFGVDKNYVPTFEKAKSFFCPSDHQRIENRFYKAVENNDELKIDVQIIIGERSRRWVRIIAEPQLKDGKYVKVQGNVQDIDKIKKTELEVLKVSEEREQILESITDAFFALDHEFIVTYWNAEAEKVLEISRDTILGKSLKKFFDMKDTLFEYYYKKAIDEQKTQNFQAFFEGTNSWYDVKAYPSVEGLSVFFRDITEQKESNTKLKRLNSELKTFTDELIAANKGLEQFSYIISHNLRAPVANILGLTDLLENDSLVEDKKKDVLKGLVGNVKRLDNVVTDLNKILQVKNKLGEEKESIRLQDMVFSIQKSLSDLMEKENVIIKTDFSACEEVITVPGYLYSIFYNLIFNGIKYRKKEIDPVIKISNTVSEDKIIFGFKDNGIGIDLDKYQDHIFGLYKRFHTHVEGKGLGLLMVKTQVEMLGGKISVASQVENGTEFTIEWNKKNLLNAKENKALHSS